MNLLQIEAIHAIVEQGSFRTAAEHLGRSQPALSTCIKNLETELNLDIFDRTSYRPKLTQEGKALFEASKKVLEAARYLARIGSELGQMKIETELRVAVDPLIPLWAIALIAAECAKPTYPVNLILSPAILKSGAIDLLARNVDLALAPLPEDTSEIDFLVIKPVTLVSAAARSSIPANRALTESYLDQNPQILVYDKGFDEPVDSLLPHPVHSAQGPKIFVPDHFTKCRLIESGVGWGRLSEEEVSINPHLTVIDPSLSTPVLLKLGVMRPKNRPIGPIARGIWRTFEEQLKMPATLPMAFS